MRSDGHLPCCDAADESLTSGLGAVAIELAVAGFAALWHGRIAEPSALVPAPPDTVTEAVDVLVARGRCELDDEGRLVGIHGLTTRTTRHSVTYNLHTHHTWCAFDSIGIPAALGIDAVALTDCRACQRILEVRISVGRTHATGEQVLWLPARTGDNLLNGFCAHADLYCSPSHLRRQVDLESTPGRCVDVNTAATMGRASWSNVSGIALTLEGGTP